MAPYGPSSQTGVDPESIALQEEDPISSVPAPVCCSAVSLLQAANLLDGPSALSSVIGIWTSIAAEEDQLILDQRAEFGDDYVVAAEERHP
jgi:hypothetical protein